MQAKLIVPFLVAMLASSVAACTPAGGACTVGSSDCCLGATCEPHVAGRSAGACGH
ncbi:hypothetical protein CTRI78_v008278 [Colletotrichum trifolii]|uniref:Uncharacterized protein n=1 Tax=Colletotrichum trifolii TaxID=5466 RepID=A0A4V3HUH2_COLTR|nr:hypothetical protein CTRI78_v008278 [Colletotrichum trifolii]